MFNFDFSQDKPNISEPIPANTLLHVRMNYTPGGADFNNTPDNQKRGQLTKSKDGDAKYLKAEFTVLRGPYKGRKFWENMTVEGGKLNEKGESIAAAITRGNMRNIIDAFQQLSSKDESPQANAKRVLVNGFADFQGKTFAIKVGVEPAKGGYGPKNKLGTILTIDHKDYPKDESAFDNVLVQSAAKPAVAAPAWGAGATVAAPATTAQPAPAFVGAAVTQTPAVNAIATHTVSQDIPAAATIAATPNDGIPAWARA